MPRKAAPAAKRVRRRLRVVARDGRPVQPRDARSAAPTNGRSAAPTNGRAAAPTNGRTAAQKRGRSSTAHRSTAAPKSQSPVAIRKGQPRVTIRKAQITLHGRRIAYRTGGWGPLLVLVHGITSSSATWNRVLPKLARHYTVLAPDLMGHGRSDKLRDDYSVGAHANTIRDLMDALGFRRATFIGHSLGGGVAMQLAYQYPERVDRLVLVAPGGFGREVSLLLRAASVPGSGNVIAMAAWRPFVEAGTALTELLGRLGLRGGTDLEEVARAYALLSDRATRTAFLHTLRSVVDYRGQRVSAVHRFDFTERHPSLIIWGGRDRIVPHTHGADVHARALHTELKLFDDAGHFPHRDEPERFVAAINRFLARDRRGGRAGRAAITA